MCVYTLHVMSSSSTAISIPCNKSKWESDMLKTGSEWKKKTNNPVFQGKANKGHFNKAVWAEAASN